jgi:hypothetical protein
VSSVFVEGRLELTFDDSWSSLVKWDEESAYQSGIRMLRTTRAVDFCGLCQLSDRSPLLYFIELKDFRGHRIENKKRLRVADTQPCSECGEIQPNLHQEIALKTRDTLAGLVAAAHQRKTDLARWRPIAEALTRWDNPIRVILWLEEDRVPGPARPSVLVDQLKKQLRWLTTHVFVASSERPPPGVTARYLQG